MKRKLVDVKDLSAQLRAAYEQKEKTEKEDKQYPRVWEHDGLEAQRQRALRLLGDRWLLHPTHSPAKGNYDGWPRVSR